MEKHLFVNDVVNIGNNSEVTILELAQLIIISIVGSTSPIEFLPPLKEGDMTRRQPDVAKMRQLLGRNFTTLEDGIQKVYSSKFFRERNCSTTSKNAFMKFGRYLLVITCIFSPAFGYAQCPTINFNVPATVCVAEQLAVTNSTTGATAYAWDFCSGDLDNTPTTVQIGALSILTNQMEGLTVVQDRGQGYWYGFAVGRHAMARIDFGKDLSNPTPGFVLLGTFGDILITATSVKMLFINSNWYGLVLNTGDGKLIRLDFGNSLTNVPTATSILSGIQASYGSMDADSMAG